MNDSDPTQSDRKYDRDFLLYGPKRNELVELWEVEKYGRDFGNDADHVHLYGMTPRDWHARGVRILGRTCVEAMKDSFGIKVATNIAAFVSQAKHKGPVGVVDPFAGSCNCLFLISHYLSEAKGIGFEFDPKVYELTSQNIAHLGAPLELVHGNYKDLLSRHRLPSDHLVVVPLCPPWGDALKSETGLHLDQTKPPILEIMRDFEKVYSSQPILYVVELNKVNEPAALKAIEDTFDWSDLRIFDANAPGHQHGILLGSRRWSPA